VAWVVIVALAVLGFGFVGAILRYVLSAAVTVRTEGWFPLGIFIVNLSGAFLLGLVAGLAERHGWPSWLSTGVGTGGIGAYTTYSTWANDSVNLWRDGHRVGLVANLVGSVAPGVALAALGMTVGGARW